MNNQIMNKEIVHKHMQKICSKHCIKDITKADLSVPETDCL